MKQPIAIQSWCFRAFKDTPSFIRELKSAGVTATELCGVHADFGDPAKYGPVLAHLRDAGVQIVAIGVEYLSGDPAKDRNRFAFCKAAGVPNMSISFSPECLDNDFAGLKAIDALAAEYGIRVGIHNHGGYDWLGNDRILGYIFGRSKHIGLHMDTAWAIDARMNPVKWVDQFKDRLCGIHIKDFTYSAKRVSSDVVLGTGILDLPGLMKALNTVGFTGPLVIEYEGDEANPAPALRQCVELVRPLL